MPASVGERQFPIRKPLDQGETGTLEDARHEAIPRLAAALG